MYAVLTCDKVVVYKPPCEVFSLPSGFTAMHGYTVHGSIAGYHLTKQAGNLVPLHASSE